MSGATEIWANNKRRPNALAHRRTAPPGLWTLSAVVALAAVMATPGVVQAASSLSQNPSRSLGDVGPSAVESSPLTATAPSPALAAGTSSVASAQIQAATQSLQQGAGPADGLSLDCSSTGLSSASCQGTVPATPASPEGLPSPASAADPVGSGTGWDVQGVPQAVSYIDFAMTWDYYDNYLLLFGGSSQGPSINVYGAETWTYQSGVWTQLEPLLSPTGRDSSGLAYSWWDDAVLLFGGYTPGTGGYLNDTWLFKAGTWTELNIKGPSPRNGFGLAYDPALEADVLFGGHSPACPQQVCNDTWLFEYDSWVNVTKTGASPPQRWQMSMAYDANDSDVVMFGGFSVGDACPSNVCGDTWQYNTSLDWSQVPTNVLCGTTAQGACPAGKAPSARHLASMAYDYATKEVILFGGWNATTDTLGDTWAYSNGTWTQLSPTLNPTGRDGAAFAFDFSPGDGYMLLVGGQPSYVTTPDFLFAWNGTDWVESLPARTVGPEATEGGSMAYDPSDGYVVFFGGFNGLTGDTDQTWTYEQGVWAQLGVVGPYGDYFAPMAWDPAGNYLLLFGGANGLNWTWAFHGGNWSNLCQSTCAFGSRAPSPRYGSGLAWDPYDRAMVLFGGSAYEGPSVGYTVVSETWAWYINSPGTGYWINETSLVGSAAPSARIFPGMTFDPFDDELVLYGGGTASAVYGDTWVLTYLFDGWRELGACGGPSQSSCASGPDPSAAMVFDYDSALDAIVMSGGVGGNAYGGYLNWQTYFFQSGSWTQCTNYDQCDGYYLGWSTFNGWGASAYDAADGYVVTSGGEGWWYSNAPSGGAEYYQIADSWVFGTPLVSQGPGFSPEEVDAGQSVTFDVGATGGGTGSYSYSWSGLPPGCSPSSPTEASFTCAVQDDGFTQYGGTSESPDSYFDPSVEVIDSDGYPSAASPDAAYWLGDLYVAPDQWVAVVSSADVADVGQTVYLGLNISYGWGPDNITWSDLPAGCVLTMTGALRERATCALTGADVGTWTPQAKVVDQTGAATFSRVLTLTVVPAPTTTAVSANTVSLDAGQTLSVWVTPSGGQGPYSYVWTGVPSACLSNAPVLSCTVPASEVGAYTPGVTVTDALGASVVASFASTIVVHAAPTATALGVTNSSGDPADTTDAGMLVTFDLTSTPGSGGDLVTWSGLPAGCTPATADSSSVACEPSGVGTFSVSATVLDSDGVSATSPIALLVVSPALTAGEVGASTHALDTGQSLALSASFLGGSGGLSYTWTGLPAGCVSSGAATVACAPDEAGRSTPSVRVTDSNGAAATATLAAPVVVSADPTTPELRVVNAASIVVSTVTTGATVQFELSATPGAGSDLIVWNGLPAGCVPATSNSTAVTCPAEATGTYTISATETDGNGVSATSPTASLTVSAPSAATPFATPVQEVELGLLAALVLLGVVAVVLAVRKPPTPLTPPPEPAAPPPGAAASPGGTGAPGGTGPSWKET